MRTMLSASRARPATTAAGVTAHLGLVALIVTLFTTHGVLAAVTAALTVGLFVGSYLLERWASRVEGRT